MKYKLERDCKICGTRFLINSSSHKYCTPECRRKGDKLLSDKYNTENRDEIRKKQREYRRRVYVPFQSVITSREDFRERVRHKIDNRLGTVLCIKSLAKRVLRELDITPKNSNDWEWIVIYDYIRKEFQKIGELFIDKEGKYTQTGDCYKFPRREKE